MTPITRTLLALTVLTAAACGANSDKTATRAGSAVVSSNPTSTSSASNSNSPTAPTDVAGADPLAPADTSERNTTTDGSVPSQPQESMPGPGRASVYAPPPGRYLYDASGTIRTSTLTGTAETGVPPTSTDDIDVSDGPTAMRMTIITRDEGRDSTQEIVVAVTDTEARLVRLSQRPDTGVDFSVNPDPPALLARLPYRPGDSWEIAWNDPGSGVSGVGTGTVDRRESISTPAGRFDAVVITVTQRLRGTVTGTLTVTTWIDPATGIQARQHVVTDLSDATGASRTDTTRALRSRPS